jgi:asparagine synthase (glutamine-hydrolysing)
MGSADGRYVIVFNGEIYNYRQLRTQLAGEGNQFLTQTDTEVLIHLYVRDRELMLPKLRGMFAFAIWDNQEKTLFLARDPFGIKPLYWHNQGYTFRFASQVKALLAGGGVPDQLEPAGLAGYWIWGYVPEPWTTHRGVYSLDAGCWLRIGYGGKCQSGAFRTIDTLFHAERLPKRSLAESGGSLCEVLQDSLRHHLIADVSVGVFLSSGIDSATIAALASACGTGLRTVTLGFEEYRGTIADETPLAEEIARHYGALHETVWLRRQDVEDDLREFLDAMDQPSIDGLNTWLVARAAAQLGLKVALSGVGGDELFGGYASFWQVPRMRRLTRPFGGLGSLGGQLRSCTAPILRRLTSEKYAGLLEYGPTWEGAYLLRRAIRMPWELEKCSKNISLESPMGSLNPEWTDLDNLRLGVERLKANQKPDSDYAAFVNSQAIISALEITRYMRPCLLRDADWAGMAHSLEIRVPLLDLPLALCVAHQQTRAKPFRKSDLAACALPSLPSAVLNRPKTGFAVPIREWRLLGDSGIHKQRGLRGWQEAIIRYWRG